MLYAMNTRWYNGANLHKDTSVESDELRNHHEPISGRGERRWASYIGQLWLVLARRRGRKRKGRRVPSASPGQHLPRASSSSWQQPQGCLASAAASALGPRCNLACLSCFPLTHTSSAIFPSTTCFYFFSDFSLIFFQVPTPPNHLSPHHPTGSRSHHNWISFIYSCIAVELFQRVRAYRNVKIKMNFAHIKWSSK